MLNPDPFEWVNIFTVPIKYTPAAAVASPDSFLLLEDGFYLLEEDGSSKIIIN